MATNTTATRMALHSDFGCGAGSQRKRFVGGAYPPNTLLMIDRLVREQLLIEVSAIAAINHSSPQVDCCCCCAG
jgi:hypothetical protein